MSIHALRAPRAILIRVGLLISLLLVAAAVVLHAQTGGPVPPAVVNVTPPVPTPPTPEAGSTITRYIRVTGSGSVHRKPDQAEITFLVSSTATSALMALKQNDDQITKVVQALQKGGVPPDNITTSGSSLVSPQSTATPANAPNPDETPTDVGEPAPPAPARYTANARVLVVTYEVSDASAIVQLGVYGGANAVLGMKFECKDIETLKQQALISALKDAADKAEILSLGVKAKILYAISVSELPATPAEIPGGAIAPPAEISVPMSIEVVYAIG